MTEYEYSPEAHQAFNNKMSSVSKWRHNMSHYDLVSPEQPYTPELARAKLADIDNYERERGRGRPRLDEAEELERLRPKTCPPPQVPPPQQQQQVFAAYPGQYWNYPPQPTVAVKQPHRKHASYAIASSSTQNLPQIHRPTPTYAYPHPAAPPPPLPQFPNHKHRHVSLSAARANTYPQTIPQQKITQVTVGHPPNPTPPPHGGKGFIPPAYYTSGNGGNPNPFLGGGVPHPGKKPFFKRMFSIFGPTRPQTSMGFHPPPPQIPVGVAPLPEPRRSSRDHRRSKSSHRREEGVYRRDRRDSF